MSCFLIFVLSKFLSGIWHYHASFVRERQAHESKNEEACLFSKKELLSYLLCSFSFLNNIQTFKKNRHKYTTVPPSTSRAAVLCFDAATRILLGKTTTYRSMFCVTKKNPGGKHDYYFQIPGAPSRSLVRV